MVLDANGQMSVSYVDMQGKTIATALAGQAPSSMQALPIADTSQYKNQAGKIMTRNLLDKGSNVLKGNTIESVNTLLVPFATQYNFSYQLPTQTLTLPTCSGTVSYNCKFDLQISVGDESGDNAPTVFNYPGIDNTNFQTSLTLPAGSYIVRKTLTISQDSLARFLQNYDSIGVGICKTQQAITDSIAAIDSTTSGCAIGSLPLATSTCLTNLGTYDQYKFNYASKIGISDTTTLSADQRADIRNQYLSDSSFCRAINGNSSHTLDNIQSQMLADMVPFGGQYASDTILGTMYYKYNVFAVSSGTLYTQPYYKYPRSRNSTLDLYYNSFGAPDTTVTSAKLANMSVLDFDGFYSNSWANSLLPYHPEFSKLKYAQDNMLSAYNFIDSVNQTISIAFSPISSDPFFTVLSTGVDKSTMKKYSDTSWLGGYSMWKMFW
jgi:hypothetical protein